LILPGAKLKGFKSIEFPETVVIVRGVPPSMLYVKVYGAVPFEPVKVTGEGVFIHTVETALIVPVG
jgi:hypothetical protein